MWVTRPMWCSKNSSWRLASTGQQALIFDAWIESFPIAGQLRFGLLKSRKRVASPASAFEGEKRKHAWIRRLHHRIDLPAVRRKLAEIFDYLGCIAMRYQGQIHVGDSKFSSLNGTSIVECLSAH